MSKPEVTIIDYGSGNLLSVQRGLEHCGANVTLTRDPERIYAAKRLVLPGVGAFDHAMEALRRLGLVSVIKEIAIQGTPLLGICLGMQLLLEESNEFVVTPGLGIIEGRVVPVPDRSVRGDVQKIPHIGWNEIIPTSEKKTWHNTLLQDIEPGNAAYFVHSFMAVPADTNDRIADCYYGGQKIAAMIGRNKTVGCQFHPEKSGDVGLKILRQFIHI
jgi:glutamine amidotransferase